MSTTKSSRGGTLTKTIEELVCSPSLVGGLQPASFATVNILLSITTFLSNSLILVVLHKESTLHAPSKLLYRCLATTDLLVGLAAQPLYVTDWMSVVHEHWTLCHYAVRATYISIMWSFSIDDGGNKRGQTSRPVVGAEIQRDCNFEGCLYSYSLLLGFMSCRLFMHHFRSAYNRFVYPDIDTTFAAYFTRFVHKDFSYS